MRQEERRDLINQNKLKFNEIKHKLSELGFTDSTERQKIFNYLNLGYYFVQPTGGSLELVTLLYSGYYGEEDFYHTELSMNLEKLSSADKMLGELEKGIEYRDLLKKMFLIGYKARNIQFEEYRYLPEMFSSFYYLYSGAEREIAIKQDAEEKAKRKALKQKETAPKKEPEKVPVNKPNQVFNKKDQSQSR